MRGYAVLLRKEVTEQWRTRRLPVVAVIFLLFGLASPVLAKYTPDIVKLAASSIDIHVPTPTIKDAVAQLIKNLSEIGVLTAILLAMGSVAGEKESGTAAFVLVKPVNRFAFLTAKFSGVAMTMAVAVLVCGLAAYLYTDLLFAPLNVLGFASACLVILLGLLEIAAVTFLGSTLVRSSIPAAGIGIVALVVAGVVASLPNIGHFTPLGLNDLASALALQQTATGWNLPVIVNAGFVVVALAASWLVFRRQEI
ncbi:MAG TPA: ABC transporter permease subunit [Candidatus Acidoferrum sp.]|jgi:ABC-2 type transport system permease protein|nr:ABC transporter permease subunit [Candidatus Acidoferrum sp.]